MDVRNFIKDNTVVDPKEAGDDDATVDAEAYDAAHDPAEDISELGLNEETILGGAEPLGAGQEYIELANPDRETKETRER